MVIEIFGFIFFNRIDDILVELSKIILKPSETLERAIEVLNSGLSIALVVDDQSTLIGIITDGDIRRSLLKHCNMDTNVTKIMNHHPITASVKDDKASVVD